MSDPVVIPGSRDVRGRLDRPDADCVVVACPPHPRHGGSRSDRRLRAVSDALASDIACLRFDYGPWDGGVGERTDAERALAWASERFERVGLFGYSFGAGVALRAAASPSVPVRACSALAPSADDGVDPLDAIDCPVHVCYGERDDTVEWEPVVARARERGHTVDALPADHRFAGQLDAVGERVATFLTARL